MPYLPTEEEWEILERHHIGSVGPIAYGKLDRKLPIGAFVVKGHSIKVDSWADLEQAIVDVKMGLYDE